MRLQSILRVLGVHEKAANRPMSSTVLGRTILDSLSIDYDVDNGFTTEDLIKHYGDIDKKHLYNIDVPIDDELLIYVLNEENRV